MSKKKKDNSNSNGNSRLPLSFSTVLLVVLLLYLILITIVDNNESNNENNNQDNNNINVINQNLRKQDAVDYAGYSDDDINNTAISVTHNDTLKYNDIHEHYTIKTDVTRSSITTTTTTDTNTNIDTNPNNNSNTFTITNNKKKRLMKVQDVYLMPITKIADIPDKVGAPVNIGWKEFLKIPAPIVQKKLPSRIPSDPNIKINFCNNDTITKMKSPQLSKADYDWCQWTFSKGGVIVGQSYGSLQANDRNKFERLNCNAVKTAGINPNCEHSFGDSHILEWKAKKIPNVCDNNKEGSKVYCYDSVSNARSCHFENVMIDFSKMHDDPRPGRSTKSRKFDDGFLKSDCDNKYRDINFYEIYSPGLDKESTVCDYVFNETVLLYSHDNIRNLGHTMSDMMNVWLILWLANEAQNIREISFLNMDALRLGHNYDDDLGAFGLHYKTAFKNVFKAIDFGTSKVCFKKLLMQTRPLLLFTWDGWWQDMDCTFRGPSSMFQQWNMQIRQNYGLLNEESIKTDKRMQILLIIRTTSSSDPHFSTRVYSNTNKITDALGTLATRGATIVVQDLIDLDFQDQVKLISESSIIIGMHGAGITHLTHMSIGSKFCCGVIEIFPIGEFSAIKGHANMARRMGHIYDSMHLAAGSNVPTDELLTKLNKIMDNIEAGKGSCVMPTVVTNPYYMLDE